MNTIQLIELAEQLTTAEMIEMLEHRLSIKASKLEHERETYDLWKKNRKRNYQDEPEMLKSMIELYNDIVPALRFCRENYKFATAAMSPRQAAFAARREQENGRWTLVQ